MNDLSGQLQVHLQPAQVSIRSTRPLTAARVFNGKPVGFVVDRLPLLFSLCASAQAAACTSACEAALGLQPTPLARQLRAQLVQAETVKEHLWRLLLDWPQAVAAALGHAPAESPAASNATRARSGNSATAAMAQVMRAYLALRAALVAGTDPFLIAASPTTVPAAVPAAAAALTGLAEEFVFQMPAARWHSEITDTAALIAWAEAQSGSAQSDSTTHPAALIRQLLANDLAGFGQNPVAPLPRLQSDDWPRLATALTGPTADAFIATPTWQDAPAETTPLARQAGTALMADLMRRYGNGLLARLVALLQELAETTVALGAAAAPEPGVEMGLETGLGSSADLGAGVGLGLAEAARGLLVHRVALDGERVQQYQILAPTEWNFHPTGVVAAGLRGLAPDHPDRKSLAQLHITAVDPCVDCVLTVG